MRHQNTARTFLRTIMLITAWLCWETAGAEYIQGIVRDSLTTEGIPYASVTFGGTSKRVIADKRGVFQATVPDGITEITAASQGYARKTIRIKRNSFSIYDIYLAPEAKELKEVVIHKGKYSKKNNPAVEFAKRLKESGKDSDPHNEPYYNYNRDERLSLGLHDFRFDSTQWFAHHVPFLKEHIDSSSLTGKPVLTVSVKETASTVHYRKKPRKEVEQLTGYRSEGIDEIVESENMQTILNELFGEVDLFQPEVPLLQNRFISPLSSIAPDFYRFYLTDTVTIDSARCIVLAFYPREKTAIGFSGHVYVTEEDNAPMQIKKVDIHTASDIGVNFIERLNITQTYTNDRNRRLKLTDMLEIVAAPVPGHGQLNVKRSIMFTNHNFDSQPDSVFATLANRVESQNVNHRDSTFWQNARTIRLNKAEQNVADLMTKLRSNKVYYWSEKILKILFQGYIPTGKDSKFDFGPVNTLASYNSLEGLRLRAGGMTTANLSPHWFARGYMAYGFHDRKWKYSIEGEYSFNKKKYHSREFPMHAIRLTHRYDVDRLGARYLTTSPDNFVLSWQRMPFRKFSYARTTRLEYVLELENNLSINISAENQRQEQTAWLPFTTYEGHNLSHYTENILGVTLRFAPGEKFYQSKTYRVNLNNDAPVFTLSHYWASKELGSRFSISKTEFEFSKRFWLSFMGSMETAAGAGHIWTSTPFPELFIPNANLSYTIRPRSFALMNPMEFINSSYVSWNLTWQLRGLILGRIPLVRKLGLREVVGFRGLYGHLSQRCKPSESNPELLRFPDEVSVAGMNHGPYMEMAVGLENILRILRVDYVWRLNYRHPGYPCDRSGIRIALNITF